VALFLRSNAVVMLGRRQLTVYHHSTRPLDPNEKRELYRYREEEEWSEMRRFF
jgi:hypothetical protein